MNPHVDPYLSFALEGRERGISLFAGHNGAPAPSSVSATVWRKNLPELKCPDEGCKAGMV